MKSILLLCALILVSTYDRNGAVTYAYKYWNNPNHRCGTYDACTPCSYWGNEACGYTSLDGDCANFVSQCLVLGGGHPKLNTGGNCRGYPCGFEEIGAFRLSDCLQTKGWSSQCGYRMAPPSNTQAGDVLVYHSDSCGSWIAHATLVTVGGSNAKITCHSAAKKDASYTYMAGSKDYYQWLHYG